MAKPDSSQSRSARVLAPAASMEANHPRLSHFPTFALSHFSRLTSHFQFRPSSHIMFPLLRRGIRSSPALASAEASSTSDRFMDGSSNQRGMMPNEPPMTKPLCGPQAHRRLPAVAAFVSGLALLLSAGCRSPHQKATPVPEPRQRADAAIKCPVDEPAPTATRPAVAPVCEQRIALGESVQGRPIELFVFGEGGETTLILGGIHGNEPTGNQVAVELVRHLTEHPEICAGRCVMVAPAVNPDGLSARRRRNANGIDINRNFPATNFPRDPDGRFAGGRQPLSEPETRAILDAIDHAHPAKIISIHAIVRGRHGNNFDGPALPLAEEMGRCNGYPVLPTMGYVTPGSLGSWAGVDHGIPTITLELPRDTDGPSCWEENREALLAAIRLPLDTPTSVDLPPPVDLPALGK